MTDQIKLRIPLKFKGLSDGRGDTMFHDLVPGYKAEVVIEVDKWDADGLQHVIEQGVGPEFTISMDDVRVCPVCKKPFLSFNRGKKYCSAYCRNILCAKNFEESHVSDIEERKARKKLLNRKHYLKRIGLEDTDEYRTVVQKLDERRG